VTPHPRYLLLQNSHPRKIHTQLVFAPSVPPVAERGGQDGNPLRGAIKAIVWPSPARIFGVESRQKSSSGTDIASIANIVPRVEARPLPDAS
jgi:hypothetical protein